VINVASDKRLGLVEIGHGGVEGQITVGSEWQASWAVIPIIHAAAFRGHSTGAGESFSLRLVTGGRGMGLGGL
jgi:hypothetical protein